MELMPLPLLINQLFLVLTVASLALWVAVLAGSCRGCINLPSGDMTRTSKPRPIVWKVCLARMTAKRMILLPQPRCRDGAGQSSDHP